MQIFFFFHPDAHGHHAGGVVAHGPEGSPVPGPTVPRNPDVESLHLEKHDKESGTGQSVNRVDDGHITTVTDESAMAQLIGVGILEFGVILHRFASLDGSPMGSKLYFFLQRLDRSYPGRKRELQSTLRRHRLPSYAYISLLKCHPVN